MLSSTPDDHGDRGCPYQLIGQDSREKARQLPPSLQPTASILLLCGLPASGKSSLAQNIIDFLKRRRNGQVEDEEFCNKFYLDYGKRFHKLKFIWVVSDVVLIDYDFIAEQELIQFATKAVSLDSANDKCYNDSSDTTIQNSFKFTNRQELVDGEGGVKNRDQKFDGNDLEAWRKSRVSALKILKEKLVDHFSMPCMNSGRLLVILDDNFHLRSMRRDVYRTCQEVVTSFSSNPNDADAATDSNGDKDASLNEKFPKANRPIIGFSTIYVATPLHECLERNKLRLGKQCIPADVIMRMANAIEPPDESRSGSSFEKFHITINNVDISCTNGVSGRIDGKTSTESNGSSITDGERRGDLAVHGFDRVLFQIDECINESLQSPIAPTLEISPDDMAQIELEIQHQREETRKCQIQRIDRLLRKLVGAVGRVDKKRSKQANDARKLILEQTKNQSDGTRNNVVLDGTLDISIVEKFVRAVQCAHSNYSLDEADSPLVRSIKDAFHDFISDND